MELHLIGKHCTYTTAEGGVVTVTHYRDNRLTSNPSRTRLERRGYSDFVCYPFSYLACTVFAICAGYLACLYFAKKICITEHPQEHSETENNNIYSNLATSELDNFMLSTELDFVP